MLGREDTDHQVTIEKSVIDRNEFFSNTELNLNVAMILNPNDWTNLEVDLDEYVSITAHALWWGYDAQAGVFA